MPEGKTLEFKRDLSSPKNMLKTLVAFSNTAGRRLLIGSLLQSLNVVRRVSLLMKCLCRS
jgi:predicted HTH transcriptional regulator